MWFWLGYACVCVQAPSGSLRRTLLPRKIVLSTKSCLWVHLHVTRFDLYVCDLEERWGVLYRPTLSRVLVSWYDLFWCAWICLVIYLDLTWLVHENLGTLNSARDQSNRSQVEVLVGKIESPGRELACALNIAILRACSVRKAKLDLLAWQYGSEGNVVRQEWWKGSDLLDVKVDGESTTVRACELVELGSWEPLYPSLFVCYLLLNMLDMSTSFRCICMLYTVYHWAVWLTPLCFP